GERSVSAEATTVFRQLEGTARSQPDQMALSDDRRSWTYPELCAGAEALASGLVGLGEGQPCPFAAISENRAEVGFWWLAGWGCGLAPSIVNPLLTPAELSKLLGRLQPVLALVAPDQLTKATEALELAQLHIPLAVFESDSISVGAAARFEDLLAAETYRGPHPDQDEIFEIAWTSGTTSDPKGVALSHGGVVRHWSAVQQALGLSQRDVSYVATPLYHQSGL